MKPKFNKGLAEPEKALTTTLPPLRLHWLGTLKARLMVASTLVIAASVAGTTTVVLDHVEQRGVQAIQDLESDHAERMAAVLGQRVLHLQQMLHASAALVPLGAPLDGMEMVVMLDAMPALTASFASVFIADLSGRLMARHDGTKATQPALDLSDRDYFRKTVASRAAVVSAPMNGRLVKEPIIQLTVPVTDPDGLVVAVLGGTLRLASRSLLDALTYAGNSGAGSIRTIVTDAEGTIISHPQRSRLMQSIETEPGLATAAASWVAQGRPINPNGFGRHDNGAFISTAGVPGGNWMLFRVAPDSALLGGMVEARQKAVLWAGGVALAGGLVLLGLLSLLLTPLSQLRRRAARLHETDLPLTDGWPTARGEIGELSRVLQQSLQQQAVGERASRAIAKQMGSVLALAPIGIGITRDRRFVLAGVEFNALLGWADGALIGRQAGDIFASEDDYTALGGAVASAFAAGQLYKADLQFRRRDGSVFWGHLQGCPVDADDGGAGTIWLLDDVTERRASHQQLSWSANHDALTRLLNRGAFESRVATFLQRSQDGMPASLMFIDLDRFKSVNDGAGHAAGDAVLCDVAAVLQAQVRAGDSAARIGGDEFALLLPGCVASVAMQLGERLRHAIGQVGVDSGGGWLGVGASIGVVEIDATEGVGTAVWLARADSACYEAKHAGRDAVRLGRGGATLRVVAGGV